MSYSLTIPQNYTSLLTLRETQHAIKYIKDEFQHALAFALTLDRVSAPLIVPCGSGINDDLNGVERKVEFTLKEMDRNAEVVQSLAKWKRMALHRYGYRPGEGIYTDMNAIRRDDNVNNTHSVFVDQWDWEKVITREERTIDYLKETVKNVVKAIVFTNRKVCMRYPVLNMHINETPYFIYSQELEDRYPNLTPSERERAICKEHGTVFIMQIGGKLKSGAPHDGRAPDYDDWALNGDLFVWNEVLDNALELTSMGVRVDAESLKKQLEEKNATDRYAFDYHRMIDQNILPLTIGGGIGQSRLCMLMLQKAHIGEVQSSVWPEEMIEECRKNNIILL
ncbi:MAG: aspartate--ammonia ligase [Clostridia bacterium]|nr:aspartate--ammonia ligase [Clostridia bacterium]